MQALTLGFGPQRFTNDLTWNERLSVPMVPSLSGGTNYAFGGAQTDRGALDFLSPTSLETQINAFQMDVVGTGADASALYVIFIGGNDLARIVSEDSSLVSSSILGGIDNIVTAITDLQSLGAEQFLIANAPDISKTPVVVEEAMGDPALLAGISGSVSFWNAELAIAVNGLADPQVRLLDINTPFLARFDNPSAFGLTNVTDEAQTTPGANPDEYLFWDGFHPTSSAHQAIADEVIALSGVPEPSSVLLLTLGFVPLLKRRRG